MTMAKHGFRASYLSMTPPVESPLSRQRTSRRGQLEWDSPPGRERHEGAAC